MRISEEENVIEFSDTPSKVGSEPSLWAMFDRKLKSGFLSRTRFQRYTSNRARQRRTGAVQSILICTLLMIVCVTGYCWIGNSGEPPQQLPEVAAALKNESPPTLFPVTIRKPTGPPVVDTGLKDAQGEAVVVSCNTCHATRQPNFENKTVAQLDEFHRDLPFSHGTISCLSCHNSADYDALKLADNSRVEFVEVMTLCAQCHGPQMKDYQHGAHGGMNGYWDLTKGPRVKNNCIDCHNPHSPQFPKMQPTFKPRDRFLEPVEH